MSVLIEAKIPFALPLCTQASMSVCSRGSTQLGATIYTERAAAGAQPPALALPECLPVAPVPFLSDIPKNPETGFWLSSCLYRTIFPCQCVYGLLVAAAVGPAAMSFGYRYVTFFWPREDHL